MPLLCAPCAGHVPSRLHRVPTASRSQRMAGHLLRAVLPGPGPRSAACRPASHPGEAKQTGTLMRPCSRGEGRVQGKGSRGRSADTAASGLPGRWGPGTRVLWTSAAQCLGPPSPHSAPDLPHGGPLPGSAALPCGGRRPLGGSAGLPKAAEHTGDPGWGVTPRSCLPCTWRQPRPPSRLSPSLL